MVSLHSNCLPSSIINIHKHALGEGIGFRGRRGGGGRGVGGGGGGGGGRGRGTHCEKQHLPETAGDCPQGLTYVRQMFALHYTQSLGTLTF